jgi:hypothetical protein
MSTYELQVKTEMGWKSICRNPSREYLEATGEKHFQRFQKRRIMKLK